MDEIGVNFISQTQTDPSRPKRTRRTGRTSRTSRISTPSKPSLRDGLGGSYFKIILISAVTSLTLISPSPLMSHTASE